ncbi:MAG: hypothetical protein N3D82_00400 [Ignisphaera sp.]|nr:hypothetical protein [Ignisphaera sp.]MCX8167476.1 hypothetical protein [Ignisphaera sp.]MDW8084660.1 hypothetical protein [Ignisphaera sp.]
MKSEGWSARVKVKLFGFGDKGRMVEIGVYSGTPIRDIVDTIVKMLNLEISHDEVLVLCRDAQLYPDDVLPSNCTELEFFPLALGG